MRLNEVIKGMETIWMKGSSQVEVHALTSDIWRVRPGSMYFASPETRTAFDVEIAMERGAVAIVTETEFVPNHRATMIQVPNIREAITWCAANFNGNPSRHLALIGVTGSAWPQKLAPILQQTLSYSGIPCGLIGSLQIEVGERLLPGIASIDDPIEIQQLLADMVRTGCKACVMEMAEDQLASAAKLGLSFYSILANLKQADTTQSANPAEILSRAPQTQKPILAIYASGTAEGVGQETSVLLLNGSDRLEAKATDLQFSSTKTSFYLQLAESVLHCDSKLVGRTNVQHLLAAAGAATILKVRPTLASGSLRKVKKLPGNLQRINSQVPFELFVDSARTPAALHQTLSDLREFCQNRIITVFGASGKTSAEFRKQLGRAAARHSDYIVLTSDNPGTEEAQSICEQITEGFEQAKDHAIVLPREAAIQHALMQAQPGDIVLIAGKGEKTYQEMESTIVPFDDSVRAREALNQVRSAHSTQAPRSKRQRVETT